MSTRTPSMIRHIDDRIAAIVRVAMAAWEGVP
jgi:hypothetical protein